MHGSVIERCKHQLRFIDLVSPCRAEGKREIIVENKF
jgi:hypothetical protein